MCVVEERTDLVERAGDQVAHQVARRPELGLAPQVVELDGEPGVAPLGDRGPVLKNAVNRWLRNWDTVLAFVSTRQVDGGTGAIYVLLQKV